MTESIAKHEILHGKRLASSNSPELIWGWETPAGKIRFQKRAEMIASGAKLGEGVRVLEIGCGTGVFTEIFAQSGAEIVALDISEELLEMARSRLEPTKNVKFQAMRFEEYNLDGQFDAIIGSSVLHHLDIGRALPKIYELLKDDGIASFAEPNMLNPQVLIQKNVKWIKKWLGDSPDETAFVKWLLRKKLSAEGFRKIELTPFDWLHPQTPVALIKSVNKIGVIFETTPLLREFAGSLYIRFYK
jgi:2-polyprenyl-3-methyl-5-hydroxy-6-metoxy-1,4-benzoquinol methylase